MRYLSLFSGIEAATAAWHPLGWECVAVSEIEPFPCAVLEHHYPNVPNLGDVTKITEQQIKDLGQIDLVVFGSPCQNLSVAGNRQGLAGTQSGLFYDSIRIIRYAREHCGARFALWENVPGAFSSNKGADFSAVVEQMAGLENVGVPKNGWGKEGAAVGANGLLEWSVLDAQWFGLAQRRKRVFAIVDFGEWESRPPILLERESLRGDSPPSRAEKQSVTADVGSCLASGTELAGPILANCGEKQWLGNQEAFRGEYHVVEPIAIAGNIIGRAPKNGGNQFGVDDSGACYTLTTNDRHAVAFAQNSRDEVRYINGDGQIAGALAANAGMKQQTYIVQPPRSVVRRLTPIECERLQGFPDNFTQIPYRNKLANDCPNGVRYKALGNSMAVNVMAWIGKRIELASTICY